MGLLTLQELMRYEQYVYSEGKSNLHSETV